MNASFRTISFSLCIAVMVSAAQGASFTGIGFLDPNGVYQYSRAADVSGDGNFVAGDSINADGYTEVIRWTGSGGMEALGFLDPNHKYGKGQGISKDGSVVVGYAHNADGATEAFRWVYADGNMYGMGALDPDHFMSIAMDISGDGNVVVGRSISEESYSFNEDGYEAFRWEDGNMVGLGCLNPSFWWSTANAVSDDGKIVVGWSRNTVNHAFRWTQGPDKMVDLGTLYGPTGTSDAYGITPDGTVAVGRSKLYSQTWVAMRCTIDPNDANDTGTMYSIGVLPPDPGENLSLARAFAVSADGSIIVGLSMVSSNPYEWVSFIWDEDSNQIRNLKDVLVNDYGLGDEDDLNQWTLNGTWGVSDDGSVIVGEGLDPNGYTQGWVVTLKAYPPNPPDANNDSYTALKNRTMTISAPGVLANDADPDNKPDPLTAVLVTDVSDGNLTLDANGGFSYTPDVNYTGSDSFTYKAYDGELYSSPATVTITIVQGTFRGVGFLDANNHTSYAYGVSPGGNVVVGKSHNGSGYQAFRWEDGNMQGLPDVSGGGWGGAAYAVSADGNIIAGVGKDWDGNTAVRWVNGSISDLGNLAGAAEAESWAYGISADGNVVVGTSNSPVTLKQAFRWTASDGNMYPLPFLDPNYPHSEGKAVSGDGNVVAGWSRCFYDLQEIPKAVRWAGGGVTDLGDLPGGAVYSYALGISSDGNVVVGTSEDKGATPPWGAFRWEDGNMEAMDPNASLSEAYDASSDGSVAVGYTYKFTGKKAFVWDDANDMRNLKTVLKDDYDLSADVNDWTLRQGCGISDDGVTIVGYGTDPNGYMQGWICTIPNHD